MAYDPMHLTHEPADVRYRRIVAFVIGFATFVVLLTGALGLYYRAVVPSRAIVAAVRPFPAPQLQPNPGEDYARFHREQLQELAGTRWVDRDHGLIHVPIERAMAFVAAKGSAAFDALDPPRTGHAAATPLQGQGETGHDEGAAPYGAGKRP